MPNLPVQGFLGSNFLLWEEGKTSHLLLSAGIIKSVMSFFREHLFFLLVGLLLPSLVSAQTMEECTIFSRNLKLGMTGSDIHSLQQLLNQSTATRVAISGAGAPGLETDYFGEKTKEAVVRFQNLYAKEVLYPVGLATGSGFFGEYSRIKLMALCKNAVTPVITDVSQSASKTSVPVIPAIPTPVATGTKSSLSSIETSNPLTNFFLTGDNDYFYVKSPSSYVVHPGDKVTIYGGGFTAENNTLKIGAQNFSGLKPTLLGMLEVVIPMDTPLGKFDLWVENTKGVSNKSFIIITLPQTIAPAINSLTPTTTQLGAIITVTGSDFTKEDNEIYLSVNTITGVPSADGKRLSFELMVDIPGVTPEMIPPGTTRDIVVPISFYIVNANGISNRVMLSIVY